MRSLIWSHFPFFVLATVCYNKCSKHYVSFWCWYIYASYICIALSHVQCCWRSGFEPLCESNLCCSMALLLWLGARSSGVPLKGIGCSLFYSLPRAPGRPPPSAATVCGCLRGAGFPRAPEQAKPTQYACTNNTTYNTVNYTFCPCCC